MPSRFPLLAALVLAFLAAVGFSSPKTGLTGSSTTGGSTTCNGLQFQGIGELRSADSYYYNGGSVGTHSGYHVAGAAFKVVAITFPTWPSGATGVDSYTQLYVVNGELGHKTGSSTFSTLGSYGGDSNLVITSPTATVGEEFWAQAAATGALSSSYHLKFYLHTVTTWHFSDHNTTDTSDAPFDYNLIKLSCHDASVDTRKTYGWPNTHGEVPADANAPYRNANFGSAIYHGGLFVGNMADGQDKSGTARLQLYPQGGSTYDSTYDFATLVVWDMGRRGTTSDITVGAYIPSESPPTSTDEDTVTWANKWSSIDPQEIDGSSTTWTTHPVSYQTFSGDVTLSTQDYRCFNIVPTNALNRAASFPANSLKGICLARVSEQSNLTSTVWRYFASKETQSGSTFPLNDCAPHVWILNPY
jgi:hypothetical protein